MMLKNRHDFKSPAYRADLDGDKMKSKEQVAKKSSSNQNVLYKYGT